MNLRKLKINRSINTPYGLKMRDAIIDVKCDSNDIPLDLFWRARLKDSEIDNCVELIEKVIVQEPIKEEIKINKKKRNK